jgi:hypothetical protein
MASIFKPYKKRLQAYKTQLQNIVSGIEKFDTLSYKSVPEACNALTQLRESVNAQLAAVQNNMVVTEAALAASVASQATSGIAKSMLMIKTWAEEIVAAAQCFKLIAEIVVLLARIPVLLSVKTAELTELSTVLALENVAKFLADLKIDIVNKINIAKSAAVRKVKELTYNSTLKTTQANITDDTKQIADRIRLLKSQGQTDQSIQQDSKIVALTQEVKALQSFEQLLKEQLAV